MKILTLFFVVLFLTPSFAQDAGKWEFKGEKEGIKIYYQQTDALLYIKLVTSIKVPLSGIVALFSEIDTYTEWCYKMVEARLLRRVSDSELYYYARYDFPWPIDDRDIILRSKIEQNPHSKAITITNTPFPDYLPENKGVQRIRNTTTRWLFVPGDGGWVYTEQLISTDSAEGLPDWLVKWTADTGPRETATGVRKMLALARYQNASLARIKE